MTIAVAGTGYVGLSIACLLGQHHHVEAVDIVAEKVDMINRRVSPIADTEIEQYLAERNLMHRQPTATPIWWSLLRQPTMMRSAISLTPVQLRR